jgi:hypothetical protein
MYKGLLFYVDLQMSMARSSISCIDLLLRQVVLMEITQVPGQQISNSVVQTNITGSLGWMEMPCIWEPWPFLLISWMHKVCWSSAFDFI